MSVEKISRLMADLAKTNKSCRFVICAKRHNMRYIRSYLNSLGFKLIRYPLPGSLPPISRMSTDPETCPLVPSSIRSSLIRSLSTSTFKLMQVSSVPLDRLTTSSWSTRTTSFPMTCNDSPTVCATRSLVLVSRIATKLHWRESR